MKTSDKMQIVAIESDVYEISVGCSSMRVELDNDDDATRQLLQDMVVAYNEVVDWKSAKTQLGATGE